MQTDEDKTIEEILAAIPSEEKQGEQETEAIPDFKDQEKEKNEEKEEKADDKLKPQSLNILTNKEILNENFPLSFENFKTNFETEEKEKKTLILRIFLNSVIDMLNCVITSYNTEKKVFKKLSYLNIETLLKKMPLYIIRLQKLIILVCPENEETIYSVIEEEKNIKKTVFKTLINLTFEELYDYFIHDCKLITNGFHFYNMEGAFKTLKDIIKESNGAIKKKDIDDFKQLEKFDNMEIETINLENSVFE